MLTREFIIYGRVQGVGFRYFSWQQANKLGLYGYVKNRPDGSVFIVGQGSIEQLDQFYHWLLQGPKTARVENVLMNPCSVTEKYHDFSIRR